MNVLLEKYNISLRSSNPQEAILNLDSILDQEIKTSKDKYEALRVQRTVKIEYQRPDTFDKLLDYLLRCSGQVLEEKKPRIIFLTNDNQSVSQNLSKRHSNYLEEDLNKENSKEKVSEKLMTRDHLEIHQSKGRGVEQDKEKYRFLGVKFSGTTAQNTPTYYDDIFEGELPTLSKDRPIKPIIYRHSGSQTRTEQPEEEARTFSEKGVLRRFVFRKSVKDDEKISHHLQP